MTIAGRNRRDADYRASKMEERGWTCFTCENKAAAVEAEESGLPVLQGTEKQVAWANTLRQRALGNLDKAINGIRWEQAEIERGCYHVNADGLARDLARLRVKLGDRPFDEAMAAARAETDARWWIDTREETWAETLAGVARRLADEEYAMSPAGKAEAVAEQDAMAEATLRPPTPVSETIAEVLHRDGKLVARYDERSDVFNGTVKRLGYRWDAIAGAWIRGHHAPTMGLPADRVAETAHELLAAGLVVAVHDPEARAKAVDRSYDPEHRRWIALVADGAHKGKFRLTWGRDEDLYGAFRGLRGATYAGKMCLVPATSRDEVLDFASTHGFRLTEGAQAKAAEVLARRERGVVVEAVARPAPEPAEERHAGPPAALPVPETVEVDSDLVDHD